MPDEMINGHKHHWEDVGEGDAFVMVHGAIGSSRGFAEQIAELSRTFRVIAVDLRGMGQSERVKSIEPSGWVDDLGALLDHLGIESAHMFGSSLGARIVLRYAIDNPSRVRSLILDNPIVANEASGNAALNQRMGDSASLPEEQKRRYEMLHGADWEEVFANFFAIRNDAAVQEYLNLRESCKSVTIPTLLTRGDNRADTVHPLPHVFELFYSIPTARMWVKPAGGCFATPEGYEMVRRFIAETGKQPATA